MRPLLVLAVLAALVTTSGCTDRTPTGAPPTGTPTSTPVVVDTSPTPDPADEQPAANADGPVIEPLPGPVPVSTGPLNLSGGQSAARAKLIVIESHAVTTIALDGSTLGTYVLPGDLRTLIEGLSVAFGRAPTIVSHAPFSWVYDWGGFSVTDFSPSILSSAEPPYKVSATVSGIGVTQFETANGIQVGDPASSATSIADEVIDGAAYYWASVDAFHVAVPGVADARIFIEISATSSTSAISEIRGPTGSWTS